MTTSTNNTMRKSYDPSYDRDAEAPTLRRSIFWGFLLLALAVPLLRSFWTPAVANEGRIVVFASAWCAVMFWSAALSCRFAGRVARFRWHWTVGCGFQILHVMIAFHVIHHWSHAQAWEQTRRVGGFGWGVYINYLFIVAWLFDCFILWLSPTWYWQRSRWWNSIIIGFMAFILFQATIVFGTVIGQMLGAVILGVLVMQWRGSHP